MTHATASATLQNLADFTGLTDLQRAYLGYIARYDGLTRAGYERHLRVWFTWCTDHGVDPLHAQRTHLELYVRERTERGAAASTVHTEMTPVKGLYKFAVIDQFIDRDPAVYIRLPKIHRTQRTALDRHELALMLMVARETSPRHWALLELLGVMALRISEALSITEKSFADVEQGYQVLRFIGKGGKPAAMPVPAPVLRALEAAAEASPSGILVCRRDGAPLSRHSAAGLVDTVTRRAKITRHINPHLIRASVVTQAFEAGLSTRDVQNLARHDDPRTTSRHYDLGKNHHDRHAVHTMAARLAA